MSSIFYWKEILPSDWEVVPLKAVASYSVSSVDKVVKEEELPVELCNYTDVYKNDFITNDLEFMKGSATEEEILKYKVEIGDVIITKDSESWDDIAIPALVKETKCNLVCGYHLSIIKAYEDKILPNFLFYCLQSKDIRVQLELASTGVTRYGLPKDEIGRASLPLPNIDLQGRIANHINNELAEITKLIEAKNNLLQTLSEKRQALIANAVTKGIDQKVKFKDSGINWIGTIPEHWKVIKVSRIFKNISSGTTPDTKNQEYYIGGEINWMLTGDLNDNIVTDTSKKITEQALEDYTTLKIYPKGSLCIAMYGATIGKTAILGVEACTNQACCVLFNSEIMMPEFAQQWFIAMRKPITMLASGGGQPNISQGIIRDLKIPLPSIEEQKIIMTELNIELNKISELENRTLKSVELLNERKSIFITSAITGQLQIQY